ncbi:MAG: cation-translocating P-type ATPase [Synechococcus sp.]
MAQKILLANRTKGLVNPRRQTKVDVDFQPLEYPMGDWHQLSADRVLRHFKTDGDRGLNSTEAAARLERCGPNVLTDGEGIDRWKILIGQFTATLVVVLIVSAIASALLGDYQEAIAILTIVVLNACLGFSQEYRSERAIAALKKLSIPTVRVRRDGSETRLSAQDLVPGDVLLLAAGDRVPADGRLVDSKNLRIAEAALTGESVPSDKIDRPLPQGSLAIADRINMAYAGTSVTHGRGTAVITATGMETELGKIAASIQSVGREPTPLQIRLDRLGKTLSGVILVLVAAIFALGLLTGEDLRAMFLTAVSLGVAAVPEGLPAVVTIALALGAQRMLRQRALIRNLPAVETLGSVTVICSDKTGTLTQNRMTVTHVAQSNGILVPFDVALEKFNLTPSVGPLGWGLLFAGSTLCNDACLITESYDKLSPTEERLEPKPLKDKDTTIRATGDPTETALAIAAARCGLYKTDLDRLFPRLAELPFDSERKRMTTVHQLPLSHELPLELAANLDWKSQFNTSQIAITKGTVDGLLERSSHIWLDGEMLLMNSERRDRLMAACDTLAQQGSRILGVAIRPLDFPCSTLNSAIPVDRPDNLEQSLLFVGMVGMSDPLRPEAKEAVAICQQAGIRPLTITGDHPATALHIARQLGIAMGDRVTTGLELDELEFKKQEFANQKQDFSEKDLGQLLQNTSVFARVSPQNKLQLVRQLQAQGHIVAMTGDGINDAPALKTADIGVAMGETGTDVAKEAADMVLLDDNFNTIVLAIKEGRVIFDNIRKFIKFTLTGNCGELIAIAIAPFIGMPFLLRPLQILWINLLGDGLLALALSVEPAEANVMTRPPYPPTESIWKRGVGRDITWIGVLLGLLLLGVGLQEWQLGRSEWQTMVFATLAFSRMGLAQVLRSDRQSVFSQGVFSNAYLSIAIAITFTLQLGVIYWPPCQDLFETLPLMWGDLALSLGCSLGLCLLVEIVKGIRNRSRSMS